MDTSKLIAKTQAKQNSSLALVPTQEDSREVGDFKLLDIFRQIKRLSQKDDYVDIEIGDQLWRLADKGQQIIEARP